MVSDGRLLVKHLTRNMSVCNKNFDTLRTFILDNDVGHIETSSNVTCNISIMVCPSLIDDGDLDKSHYS